MLRWRYTDPIIIEGWWVGWGSVSDQTGVNAALRALGSPMRYSRDRSGGGPRVNPSFRVPGAMAKLSPITPPVY